MHQLTASQPTAVVRALTRRGDKVLFVRRAADDSLGGQLECPGGKVDTLPCGRQETHREALCREVAEETGLKVTGDPVLLTQEQAVSPRGKAVHVFTYLADAEGDVELSEEHDDAFWHPRGAPLTEAATPAARAALRALGN